MGRITGFSPPEGDGFQSPLSHRAGLLYLGGLQVVGHVLEPQQRAVGGSQQEALEGSGILWPQAGVHQLGLALHQSLLCLLLLLLDLMPRLLLGLEGYRVAKRKWRRWRWRRERGKRKVVVIGLNDSVVIPFPCAIIAGFVLISIADVAIYGPHNKDTEPSCVCTAAAIPQIPHMGSIKFILL